MNLTLSHNLAIFVSSCGSDLISIRSVTVCFHGRVLFLCPVQLCFSSEIDENNIVESAVN